MPTNILQLPVLTFETIAYSNSDLVDGIHGFTISDDDPTPIDLTGISFKAQVRKAAGDAVVYLDCQSTNWDGGSGNGRISVSAALGIISWNVGYADLPSDRNLLVVDILAKGDGYTLLVATGTFQVQTGVTTP